ncbi:hypothetical protein BDD43_3383 [Mucilaginibacter gracilis]|uniref:K1 capsule-specific polysaccharide lyase C-terminal domain-containing protein n=1 Tax=Mucilaginibacter gracilis TaxID=423350 RepID=A0A495J3C9_9SPHI|nr:hypothetical protein [Mucilaginibacter gracilis]RKR83181.1 hypothetical protein BDD43_3383 [Mucilaginibacter gracilis]
MSANLEIGGAVKRTQKGPADWYYSGGDNEAWANLAAAIAGVPASIRPGKTVGVYVAGAIVEYWWPTTAVGDSDLVIKVPPIVTDATPTSASTNPVQSGGVYTALASKQASLGFTAENTANKNAANGYAGLDGTGKVPSAQLPSYVDDVLEYANYAALPGTGETGKIYVTIDTNFEYRWSGSAYIRLVASPGTTDALTEGTTNLYFTTGRVLGTLLTGLSLATATPAVATDSVLTAIGKLQAQATANLNNKDASNGYAGLTGFKINFKNTANTFTSFFTNANTAAHTYTFPDKDMTVAAVGDCFTKTETNNANLYLDSTNGRVGLATSAPTHTLTLGSAATGLAYYNTADQTTNYERFRTYWNSNTFTLTTEKGGTGTDRGFSLSGNATSTIGVNGRTLTITGIGINQTGGFAFNSLTTANGASNISSIGAFTSSALNNQGVAILDSYTLSGTAGYRALWVSPYEVSVGSGNRFLIDLGLNTAANGAGTHTSKFSVNYSGDTLIGGQLAVPGGPIQTATNFTAGNFYSVGFNAASLPNTQSTWLFGGASSVQVRVNIGGTTIGTLTAANNYTNALIANTGYNTAATGTHAFANSLTVLPVTLGTNNGASVTNTASVYIEGAGTGGTNNYALYSKAGANYFGGNSLFGTATDNLTDKVQVSGNLNLITAGNKIKIATGTNASIGTATLVSGTVTINTTAAATSSIILLTRATAGGTTGTLSYTIVNGTSFTINSSSSADTSTIAYVIIN